jgi:hypothetical protein
VGLVVYFWKAAGNSRSLLLDSPGDDPETRLLLGMIQVVLALVFIPLMSLILLLVLFYLIAESSVLHVRSGVHLVAHCFGSSVRRGLRSYQHQPIKASSRCGSLRA